jgi:signal transduction histidine kinase
VTEQPRDGAGAGLSRIRAVAARLARPGRASTGAVPGDGPVTEPEVPGPDRDPGAGGMAPATEPGEPGAGGMAPATEPGEPGAGNIAPATEPVPPRPDPGTGAAGAEPGEHGPAAWHRAQRPRPGRQPVPAAVPGPATALPAAEPEPERAGAAPATKPGPAGRPRGLSRPATERASAMAARFAGGWPFGRIIGIGVLAVGLFALLAIGVGGTAMADLGTARDHVVNTLDPAAYRASQLEVALLDQETGVRGYALGAQPAFLKPYYEGLASQAQQVTRLRQLLGGMPGATAELNLVLQRVAIWRSSYAQPTINQVSTSGQPIAGASPDQGKAGFDRARSALAALQADLATQREQAVGTLHNSDSVLNATLVVIAIALLVTVLALAFGLWRSAILPLSRLAADARQVAEGDFEHQVEPGGPAEMRAVGLDVNRMRERILAELSALQAANATLEARTEDLQRSNSELEQFAYVASHDLQEPLRKVASFCQLLQRRYAGRLDAKADEYIEHAVDGAKRMQALINDLLAFSRVGRTAQRREPVSCAVLLAQAWANLAADVRRTQATIEVGELPVVLGEASLLTAVFQNLINNALKFRADEPPRVTVSARRDGGFWLFSFGDNGIGIEPEYAERIFVIFQRLHDKATYPGTGIGLAMVRKIIEYHGGRVWLDTTITAGARFWFTLPALPEEEDADD